MPRAPWVGDALYSVAARFVDECLRRDGSLFTPGRAIWTPDAIGRFMERFMQFDMSNEDFMTKLKLQLDGLDPSAVQVAAEAFFVHLLAEDDTGAALKRQHVATALAASPAPVALPDDVSAALESGLARIGVRKSKRDQELRFLLQFALDWKQELNDDDRSLLLADHREFKSFLERTQLHGATYQVEALLHLVFPDSFEPVVSRGAKTRIVSTFGAVAGVSPDGDLDESLALIRERLTPIAGPDLSFYRSSLRRVWDEKQTEGWREFTHWAGRLFSQERFDGLERNYKLQIAGRLDAAKQALDSVAWLPELKRAFGGENNLTNRFEHTPFLAWCEEHPEQAAAFLRDLWHGDVVSVLDGALSKVPSGVLRGRAARASVASFLLMGRGAAVYPFFRGTRRLWRSPS